MLLHVDIQPNQKKKRRKIFRFEECWSKDRRCEDAIKRRWRSRYGSCIANIDGLKSMGLEFEEFTASNTRKEILRVEKILHDDTMWLGSDVDIERFKNLRSTMPSF